MKNASKHPSLRQETRGVGIPVFFATTNGQTRRIAERVAATLRERGFRSAALDVASLEALSVDWNEVKGAVLGAPLYLGRYPRQAADFARAHRDRLNAVPSAFFGVSLSAASRNPEEAEAARNLARGFAEGAGWKPFTIASLAGALAYSRYGFLVRFIMRRIARREGAPTDSSRDYELTDWGQVARFANEVADAVLLNWSFVVEGPGWGAEARLH